MIASTSLLVVLLIAPPQSILESRTRTDHFVIFHRPGQTAAAQDLAKVAGAWRRRVLSDLGTDGPDGTRVFLALDLADMRAVAPQGVKVPVWAAGMAFPRLNLILLKLTSGSGQSTDVDLVFAHEFSHLALDHAVGFKPIPRWFREGFAIYQSGEWSFGRTRALAGGAISGRLFSLEALSGQFPTAVRDVELAYAQSIDFISFLLGEYGPKPFRQMIRLLSEDWDFFLALEEAYDDGLFAIEAAWLSDLKMRFTWIPLITGTATLWFLATLVFILAYLKKRRRRLAALEKLDDEEGPSQAGQDLPPHFRSIPISRVKRDTYEEDHE
jgi:hypothetical protein